MNLSLVVVVAIFVLIAVRQVGNVRLQIWQIMAAGAIVVVVAGEISPGEALAAVNVDVLVFLFTTFIRWLLMPTLVNLFLTYLLLKWLFPDDFHEARLVHSQEPIRDHDLAGIARIAVNILLVLVLAKVAAGLLDIGHNFQLTHIAVGAALPIVVGSTRRWRLIRHIDWTTLVFFAAMFVVMASVWRSGTIQEVLRVTQADFRSIEIILASSVMLSQIISNVPLVALLQPVVLHAGADISGLMALAAGSTIAGNLMILGAASNVIIIQKAERHARESLSFVQFFKAGLPLTVIQLGVYWLFLRFT